MNKRIFSLLLAVALVLTFAPFAPVAAQAEDVDYTAGLVDADTSTDGMQAVCAQCGTQQTWTPLTEASLTYQCVSTEAAGTHHHFYLTEDLNVANTIQIATTLGTAEKAAGRVVVCLNLNGFDISSAAGAALYNTWNSTLYLLGTGDIIGGTDAAMQFGTGPVYVRSKTTFKMADAATSNGILLLGGNKSTKPKVYLYENVTVDGQKTGRCVSMSTVYNSATDRGELYINGATIQNGYSAANGGGFYIQQGVVIMNSGLVTGCEANNGGSVNVAGSAGHFNFYDGTIENGLANDSNSGGYGGNVFIQSGGNFRFGYAVRDEEKGTNLGNPTMTGGVANTNGGNIAVHAANLYMFIGTISNPVKGKTNCRNVWFLDTTGKATFAGGTITNPNGGQNINFANDTTKPVLEISGAAKVNQIVIPTATTKPTITIKAGYTGTLQLRHFASSVLSSYGSGCTIPGLTPEAGYANTGTITATGGNTVTPVAYNGQFYGKAGVSLNYYDLNHKYISGSLTKYTTVQEALDVYAAKVAEGETLPCLRLTANVDVVDLTNFNGKLDLMLNSFTLGSLVIGENAEVGIADANVLKTNNNGTADDKTDDTTYLQYGVVETITNNGTLNEVHQNNGNGTYMLLETANGYEVREITGGLRAFLRTSTETLAFQPEIGVKESDKCSAEDAKLLAAKIEDAGIIISGGNGSETVSYSTNAWTVADDAMTTITSGTEVYKNARVALESTGTDWMDQDITATTYITVNGKTYECKSKTVNFKEAVEAKYNTADNYEAVKAMVEGSEYWETIYSTWELVAPESAEA